MNEAHTRAYTFLNKHSLAVLSTATKDGHPWGSAVYYAIDKTFTFYFMVRTGSRKYSTIKDNPSVAFTIADNDEQTTVQVSGVAEELDDTSEASAEAFRKLAAIHSPGQLRWTPPVSKLDNGKIVVIALKPDTLQFSQFDVNHQPPKADVIHII